MQDFFHIPSAMPNSLCCQITQNGKEQGKKSSWVLKINSREDIWMRKMWLQGEEKKSGSGRDDRVQEPTKERKKE